MSTATVRSRIVSLDVLRGFALLGILIMNMISFGLPGAHYFNPIAEGTLSGADQWSFYFSHIFANQKFMSIFSMLFGAGVVLMASSIEQKGGSATKRHYIRNLWLLLFGLIHAYLIWHGDILTLYAICAIWIYLFRKKSVVSLLIWSGFFMMLKYGLSYFLSSWSMEHTDEICAIWQPTMEEISAEVVAFQGSWFDQLPFRAMNAIGMHTFMFIADFGWHITSLMLLGMALFKAKVLTGERSTRFYTWMAIIGLFVGLAIGILGVVMNNEAGWTCESSFLSGVPYNTIASIPMALGYIALIMLWCRNAPNFVERWLAPVGRMALTNYLMQSLLATFFFYGHGLGFFNSLSRSQLWLVILVIWLFQIFFSKYWMKRYHFGPFEWLWRSLTYGKRQKMRRSE